MKKKAIIIAACAIVAAAAWIAFCGYEWSWGSFHSLHDIKTAGLPGNAEYYSPERVEQMENSPLEGRHIIFLGSSVTYGAASKGVSFADYIAARNGCTITKEAVSGTTLVDSGPDSYIARMKRLDKGIRADAFVCQLSTNDASQNKPLGKVSSDGAYDTSTVAGAIEYIISYARETWGCPVVFYISPRYSSENYAAMVELMEEIAGKWEVKLIDMWNDEAFNAISGEERSLYMADPIHPTEAGYLEWWTPYMENALYEVIK